MHRAFRAALVLAVLAFPAHSLRAQEIVLEPEDPTNKNLKFCDTVHILSTCDSRHYVPPVGIVGIGSVIFLDDEPYVVLWIGPGYYLDSGVVVHALGTPASQLSGQQWVEAYPRLGRRHVSRSWADLNGDSLLSRADTLLFDGGRSARIRDVRLNLRVRPVFGY